LEIGSHDSQQSGSERLSEQVGGGDSASVCDVFVLDIAVLLYIWISNKFVIIYNV